MKKVIDAIYRRDMRLISTICGITEHW